MTPAQRTKLQRETVERIKALPDYKPFGDLEPFRCRACGEIGHRRGETTCIERRYRRR